MATNTPAASRFDFLDTEAPLFGQRHFRAAKLEDLYDNPGLSLSPTNRYARLVFSGVVTNRPLVLQASEALRHWQSLLTTNPAMTNLLFLDTNAPAFDQRFYGTIGIGK